ncbi:MAG: TonB-dependent receptor [Cellvibrionaceae bacterium]|nr:TonB-dependent receptor [Cellvibrionaceae bacterium]
MRTKPLSLAIACLIAAPSFAQSTQLNHDLAIELIEVTAQKPEQPSGAELFSEAPITRPTHDAGELLRSVTGMTALRRGGRGFDPIIRGQSQANINIISNGAFNYGACPGRMDPPSTYVGVESFDSVQVIKGHRSVVHGSGGSGGTLLFEHIRPEFGAGNISGSVTSGYTSNSDLSNIGADIAAGGEAGYVRLFAARKRSDNYQDGNGKQVASAFDSDSFGVVAGVDIGAADYLELSYEQANEGDVWYGGNGMDAVYADSHTSSLKWQRSDALGAIDGWELNLYRSEVEHLMDNYSVRNRNKMPNGMSAPSSSDTWGGKWLATIESGSANWTIGADYQANDRLANLYMDMGKDGSLDMLVARMWPAAQQRQSGVFAELDYQLSDSDSLRVGVRWDDYEAEVAEGILAAGKMAAATPTTLYQKFYSTGKTQSDDSAISLVLGWDHQLDSGGLISANVSRSVRRPDVTEQWIARAAGGRFWVGNPDIRAEVHQQLDLTAMRDQGRFKLSLTAFYDDISDYIERYKAANASLYRNIDAELYGAEFDVAVDVVAGLSARAGIAYTRGKGDNGDLAQIAPLEGRFNLDYQGQQWAIGAEWVVSDRQTHFNPTVDVNEETAGFGVVHLYGHWNISPELVFEAGVENLTDRAYAYHVNAANADPFNPEAVRVNEPGRQSWVKLRYQF